MELPATEAVSLPYHVFINHRGPDVKKTLASLIYHHLKSFGLRVFLDQKELHTGDALSPAILGAIQSASVHIAMFSKLYAESRWCLDELCWILDRHNGKTIPVFCDVEPTDLRYIDSENGCYREAFERHQRKGRVAKKDIQKWKTALNKASEISGVPFKTNESDLGEFLQIIVKNVLKEVKWEPLFVAAYPSGLEQAAEELNNEIKKQSELNGTIIVGIAGMAGLGKSTLAAYLYNLKRSDFRRACFLSDVRKKDLTSLQRKLLRDLLGYDFRIEDTRQGKGIFRNRQRGLPVLIVLDDVDRIEQINSLLETNDVGSRSLILITSRDQDLLRRSSPKTVVYNMKPLQGKHALQLFCWHAFHQSEPCPGFGDLVEEALKICQGLPLSLRVCGGQFLGRCEEEYWNRQLGNLTRRLPDDIMERLKVSYEALNREEKEIFLDLGSFFVGEDKELAVCVFEGLGYKYVRDCLDNLHKKCLVEYHYEVQSAYENKSPTKEPIDGIPWSNLSHQITGYDSDDNYDYLYLPKRDKITMHDHFRQLARDIAREEFGVLPKSNPLRLICSDDIEELMSKLQGAADSCWIRGFRTRNPLDCTSYIKGVGVRFFVIEVPIDLSSLFGLWDISGDLLWLRLRSFNSIYFPDSISLGNLRVLELEGQGDLEQLFQRFNVVTPRNLSVLNIELQHSSAIRKPSMRWTGRMKMPVGGLVLSPAIETRSTSGSVMAPFPFGRRHAPAPAPNAFNFSRFLQCIGTSIKFPSKIVLKNIRYLRSLPNDFGELKRLRHLDLSGCSNLTELPNSFSKLMHLQCLFLRDCIQLSLPLHILGNMSSLEYVDFKGCCKLKYLPEGIANQRSLIYLNLLYTDLEWPLNVQLSEKLQRLRIGNYRKTDLEWPLDVQLPGKMASADVQPRLQMALADVQPRWEMASSAVQLPEKIPQSLGGLRRLKELKELILIDFDGPSCILWEEIAGPNMKVLVIRDCPIYIFSFKEQGGRHVAMDALIDFTLRKTGISEMCIPEGVLPSLETLDLSENGKLLHVKYLPSTLVRLNLQGCFRLKALTNLSNLVHLKFLCINHCGELETLNVEGLTSLEEIQAEACWALQSIQGLSRLQRLKYLRISTYKNVMWNDICNFLTSTSREKLSTAFFSGESAITYWDTMMVTLREMQSITANFNLNVVDVVFPPELESVDDVFTTRYPTIEFQTKMEDFQSYGGILMCFLTGTNEVDLFRVRFEASNDGGSAEEYEFHAEYRYGSAVKVDVLMWTEECNLFRDEKGYNSISVSCISSRFRASVDLIKGWIMMVDKNVDVSQVCNQIMSALSLH